MRVERRLRLLCGIRRLQSFYFADVENKALNGNLPSRYSKEKTYRLRASDACKTAHFFVALLENKALNGNLASSFASKSSKQSTYRYHILNQLLSSNLGGYGKQQKSAAALGFAGTSPYYKYSESR